MVLSAAQGLTTSLDITKVRLIAVNSYFHDLDTLLENNACITPETGRGMMPSEGVALACVNSSIKGLKLESDIAAITR